MEVSTLWSIRRDETFANTILGVLFTTAEAVAKIVNPIFAKEHRAGAI